MRRSARGLLGGVDMTDEMRRELGVRLNANQSSKNQILSALTDDAELLLGQKRHRDLGSNTIDTFRDRFKDNLRDNFSTMELKVDTCLHTPSMIPD